MEEQDKVSLAFVLDGYVKEIFECDKRMAAILLSSPIIIDITSRRHLVDGIDILYDEKTDLFYKRVDLMDQYRPGLSVYPHNDNNYNHYVARMNNDAIISRPAVRLDTPHRDSEQHLDKKPCNCGK